MVLGKMPNQCHPEEKSKVSNEGIEESDVSDMEECAMEDLPGWWTSQQRVAGCR